MSVSLAVFAPNSGVMGTGAIRSRARDVSGSLHNEPRLVVGVISPLHLDVRFSCVAACRRPQVTRSGRGVSSLDGGGAVVAPTNVSSMFFVLRWMRASAPPDSASSPLLQCSVPAPNTQVPLPAL